MNKRIICEITPLSEDDFFIVLNHYNAKFDFPVHFHPEFELNMVINSRGKRIIGDSIQDYDNLDLVLIGPNTPHAWTGSSETDNAQVVTIQFHNDFLGEKILGRKLMLTIRELLEKASRGGPLLPRGGHQSERADYETFRKPRFRFFTRFFIYSLRPLDKQKPKKYWQHHPISDISMHRKAAELKRLTNTFSSTSVKT